jgi:hypothetical protein
VALRRQVKNFFRLNPIKELNQIGRIGDIAVVKKQSNAIDVRVLVEMIDPPRVESGGAPDYPVHLVAFGEKQLGQI